MSSVDPTVRKPGLEAGRLSRLLAPLGAGLTLEVERVLRERGMPTGGDGEIELEELGHESHVYRVRAVAEGWNTSVIVKLLDPGAAQRNRLVARRWLPWLNLQHVGPALLGATAAEDVEWIWHVYEDLGDTTLDAYRADRDGVSAAVDLIADLHTRAAGHPVVAECRRDGHDLGMHFFINSVTDALSLLGSLEPPAVSPSSEQEQVRDRLRRRLDRLLADAPRRARVREEVGGPMTMLHGDLWTTNILLDSTGTGVRLIDWDRVGAGPFSYDLSILLYRFDGRDREWILDRYRNAVAREGWRLGQVPELNLLFDTPECARYAYRISWPAIALLHDGADWGFGELAEIDAWFEALQPAIQE